MTELLQNVREIEAAREEIKKPSFMTQLFAGDPDFSLVVPFPIQEPEDRGVGDEYLAKLAVFLRDQVDPAEIERAAKIPQSVLDGLRGLGAFGMAIPRAYGGLGLSQTNYDRALALVASRCNVLALLLSVHQSIGVSRPLLLFGTEEQRQFWLPRLARGELSAFALTEPRIGSDPANMQTTATLSDDKSHYLIQGEKLWCTNSPIADIIVLTAKVEGKVTAFIVDMHAPGVEIRQRCSFMGCRGIENGWVRFDRVRVPAENVLGGVGKGLRVALTALNYGRVSVAAICLGMAQQVFLPAARWAAEREAFGKPIGLHELNTHKLARAAADLFTMEALIHLTSGLIDRGRSDFRVEAAITKLVCSERLWDAVDTAMQIRGGRGYETAESLAARGETADPIEQIFRDARLYLIGEGSSEILKLFIAREVWDQHLKRAAPIFAQPLPRDGSLVERAPRYAQLARDAGKVGTFYARWYAERLMPDGSVSEAAATIRDQRLRDELGYVKGTSRRLARVILQKMARYTTTLEQRQAVVARLADIGIDLFTMATVCSYADAHPRGVPLALQTCDDAKKRIEDRFRDLSDNRDEATTRLGREVLDRKFDWLIDGSYEAEVAEAGHAE